MAASAAEADYSAYDPVVPPQSVRLATTDEFFRVSKADLPPGATPIVDDADGVVIGCQRVTGSNTWTYDLDGRVVRAMCP